MMINIYFAALLNPDPPEEQKKHFDLLEFTLLIKNGVEPEQLQALDDLLMSANGFGPIAIFNTLLPLLMSPTLTEAGQYMLLVAVDRLIIHFGDRCLSFVHKILVVTEPQLLEEWAPLRQLGCKVVTDLTRAVGLATMIYYMREDLSHLDSYVRNVTAQAFALVAVSESIPAVVPFLRTICVSPRSSLLSTASGIRIIRQIGRLMGLNQILSTNIQAYIVPLLHILKVPSLAGIDNNAALIALAELVDLVPCHHPDIVSFVGFALQPVWSIVQGSADSWNLFRFANSMVSLLRHLEKKEGARHTSLLFKALFNSPRLIPRKELQILHRCIGLGLIDQNLITENYILPLFKRLWNYILTDAAYLYLSLLVESTLFLAENLGSELVIERLHLREFDSSFPGLISKLIKSNPMQC